MEKKKVFVIMPFQDQFFEVYEMLKRQFEEKFEFSNANDEGNSQNVLRDVVQPIYEADIVIADLTGLNPNVMYELGLAHTFNKKTIIITQDDLNKLPFDLKQYRAKDYSTHFVQFSKLVDYLKRTLEGAIDDTVAFGNPVMDFLSSEQIKPANWFTENRVTNFDNDDDNGFLDFLADIESDSEHLTNNLNEIGIDIREMNDGMIKSTAEINRVKKTGGGNNASYIRKEAKKVSKLIDSFSTKLKNHNATNADLWDRIEYNSLKLMENQHASRENNRSGIKKYVNSLIELKAVAPNSKLAVLQLKNALEEGIGLERTLNQAIRFVVQDLQVFIDFIDNMDVSIEKIVGKSRFVIGDIS